MASKRKVSNPLALAVMALLFERPMHPYEMVSTMRERGKHESVRLRYSSLYSVVGALEREGLISSRETVRELLSEPVKEYTQFAAGLSFIVALPPDEAAGLLEERVRLLEDEVGELRSHLDEAAERLGLPRLFLIESEHELVLREAELGWVRDLVAEIRAGTLGGMRGWCSFHSRPAGVSVAWETEGSDG